MSTAVNLAPSGSSRKKDWRVPRRMLAVGALLILYSVALQILSGCYRTELGGYPDEPAHLITGLMVRDYVASGLRGSPVNFAENYYIHYPKVAFGIWPPLFHFVEGAWFLAVPPSKTAVFSLQAVITGLLATCLAAVTAAACTPLVGVAAGFAFVSLPVVQRFTGMVMADGLMALFAFCAMLAMARYARDGRRGQAVCVGVLIGLALMTKTNALPLALLPPLTFLLLRQPRRILSGSLWLAGAIALLIAAPWQILATRMWTSTLSPKPYSADLVWQLVQAHAGIYFNGLGPVIFALACAGVFFKVIRPFRDRSLEPLWAAAASLSVSMLLFTFAPLPAEPRYHIAPLAALCLFAGAGVLDLARLWRNRLTLSARTAVILGCAALLFGATTFTIPKRQAYGYADVAPTLERPQYHEAAILVSSENFGEGMLIAETALLERRPSHYVLRATKMLASARWDGDGYQLLYQTPEEVDRFLKSIPIRIVVFDETPGLARMPHHALLAQALQKEGGWKRIGEYFGSWPEPRPGNRIVVYELQNDARPPGDIKVDMRYTLKKHLQ